MNSTLAGMVIGLAFPVVMTIVTGGSHSLAADFRGATVAMHIVATRVQ
jgi:hypothetical protein